MIVIEPANPQVVYVPQYNPTVVYTQPATTTVVVHEDDDDAAIAASVIGFAAAEEGHRAGGSGSGPTPFYGCYFRILEGQGESARGGAVDYVVDGEMSLGFALVAWSVHYDASGVMTFLVNQDGVVEEKDLGPETHAAVRSITRYDRDPAWRRVQAESSPRP